MKQYNIAVIGATGLVGSTFLSILEEYNTPIDTLYLYASKKSAGKKIMFKGNDYTVLELSFDTIMGKKIDYALFSAGGTTSKEYAQAFVNIGAIVIDNSSQFRMDDFVPLIVPEVNMECAYDNVGIIANPNCSTIQSVLPLKVLNDHYGIKSVAYTTYQAVSGSGIQGINDLKRTSEGLDPINYPYPIYNNVLPHIDEFLENGSTKEEAKMVYETRKILGLPSLEISATCVRVPVTNSHSVEILVELENDFEVSEVREKLANQVGITVIDDPSNLKYPIPTMATNSDEVYVGRIRKSITNNKKLHIFTVSDNIRKGAASNAVQIVMNLIKGRDSNV